jgi:protease I
VRGRRQGEVWQDTEVVEDANFITSRRPGEIPAFGRAVIRASSE